MTAGSHWRRALARAVDLATVVFVQLAVVLLGVGVLLDRVADAFAPEPWGRSFAPRALFVVLASVYEIVFVAVRGQTPAKELLHLKVARVGTGLAPGPASAARRWLPFAAALVLPDLRLAAVALVLLGLPGPGHRSPVDHLAGTWVIAYDADREEGGAEPVDLEPLRRLREEHGWVGRVLRRLRATTPEDPRARGPCHPAG